MGSADEREQSSVIVRPTNVTTRPVLLLAALAFGSILFLSTSRSDESGGPKSASGVALPETGFRVATFTMW